MYVYLINVYYVLVYVIYKCVCVRSYVLCRY